METSFYKDVETNHLATYCILRANYKDTRVIFKQHELIVKRGSFITSLYHISKDTGLSIQNIRTSLKVLTNAGFLTHESTSIFTQINLINYEQYQPNEEKTPRQLTQSDMMNTPEFNTETNTENNTLYIDGNYENINTAPNTETNKPLTQSNEKTNNRQEVIYKKYKKYIVKTKDFTKPTIEDIKAYCKQIKYNLDAEHFFHHYEANGWKQKGGLPIKNWKSAIVTWKKNERKFVGKNSMNSTGGRQTDNLPEI